MYRVKSESEDKQTQEAAKRRFTRTGRNPTNQRASWRSHSISFPSRFFSTSFPSFSPRPPNNSNKSTTRLSRSSTSPLDLSCIHSLYRVSLPRHSLGYTHTHTHTFDSLSALVKVGLEEREEGVGLGGLCISQSRHGWASPIQTASARRLD